MRRRSDAAAEEAARRANATSGVSAALEEARVRTEEAWGQANYPDRMQVAADFATAAVLRAEGFVVSGDLSPVLLAKLNSTRAGVEDLVRHVRLIAEAARIYFDHADSPNPGSNEDRAESARRLAAAFRAFGLDQAAQSETEVTRAIVASRARDKLLGYLAECVRGPGSGRATPDRWSVPHGTDRLRRSPGTVASDHGSERQRSPPGVGQLARSDEPKHRVDRRTCPSG